MSVQSAIHIRSNNTAAVPSMEIMDELFHTSLPPATSSFKDIIQALQNYTKNQFSIKSSTLKEPTSNAFNNCNGRWSEYVYAAYAWNKLASINSQTNAQFYYIYVKLPNNNSSDNEWIALLNSANLSRLNSFTRDSSDPQVASSTHNRFNLCSSNPDAVILRFTPAEYQNLNLPLDSRIAISNLSLNTMQGMDNMFTALLGKVVPYDNLQCFLSVKTSIRPDRRYQFVHEGNNIKAILLFLIAHRVDSRLTRADVQKKFFAISMAPISQPDLNAMETAMTACLMDLTCEPIWAVDKLYECLSPSQISSQIDDMLS